ncbi:T7SS effector LXG polymorphic toxin [Cerasibacillus terrae]|uniref:T7SS effector LXG polymorphic toxin n=1 Tax=Cerasibacillus terrae TaxID=2498845 RepID=UPI0017473E40|nr:T7SS effector LXG polymorphic toxin [Cerasibacillus terrae]
MKVLDVDVLQSGIDDTLKDIDNLQGQISAVQRAVRDFAGLDDALSGKGGEAIRSFYNDFHQPFLIFLHQSLTDYQHTLTELKEAVETFEPNANGYVSQEFLENDVKSGLDDVKTTAIDFTSEANSIIGSVQDIVSIEKIDESEVVDNVQRGKEKADHIVEELNILDEYGVSQLEQTKQDLDTMLNYLTEIESKFQSGDLSIRNFNVKAIQGLESFQMIQDSIYNKNQETILGLYGDDFEKLPMSEIEKMHANVLGDLVKDEKVILEQAFHALKNGEIDRKDYANLLKTIVYKDEKMDEKVESSIWDKIKGGTATVGRTLKGAGLGIYDVGKDTVVGIYDMITDPEGTAESLYQAASHPIDTGKYIAQAISDSYKRDMINGDAESRAHWVTYALGTIVGTKGAGTATKAGVATTKTAARNAGKHVKNVNLSNLFPYAPRYQFAPAGPVPYNVVDGMNLKEQLMMFSKHFLDKKKTKLKPNITYRAGEFDYLYKTDQFGRIKEWVAEDLKLTDRENRLSHNPNTPGKQPGDHAGHLAGDRFGGSPDLDNLVSQLSEVNLSHYKKIENQWADAIKDGKHVTVNVDVNYDGARLRPESFDIKYMIDGKAYFRNIDN